MRNYKWLIIGVLIVLTSCKTTRITKQLHAKIQSDFYQNQFTGILVIDANTKDTLINYNADKYFTPASNTKIATLYSALQLLPKKVPAFKYSVKNDTVSLLGVGNPTLLHTFFKDSTALQFVRKFKGITIIEGHLKNTAFGPGWAWEDYDTYFSPERTAFPIYGNVITIKHDTELDCYPKLLQTHISPKENRKFSRDLRKNQFYYNPTKKTKEIPMIMDTVLVHKLWQNLLGNKVFFSRDIPKKMKVVYTEIASDSLYKRMMYKSDNFLAEQMLIMASSTMSDTLDSKKVRAYILKNKLAHLKQRPRWVDGSGLSRYNLFTPMSFVEILGKLYQDIPQKRLFDFFPIGRKEISTWYLGNPKQYLFAKSGYLGNNYNLSGYLVTKSNKVLLFSFMNNHYKKPTSELKKQMQLFFEALRDGY